MPKTKYICQEMCWNARPLWALQRGDGVNVCRFWKNKLFSTPFSEMLVGIDGSALSIPFLVCSPHSEEGEPLEHSWHGWNLFSKVRRLFRHSSAQRWPEALRFSLVTTLSDLAFTLLVLQDYLWQWTRLKSWHHPYRPVATPTGSSCR